MHRLAILGLLLAAQAFAAHCPLNGALPKGVATDRACRLFRVVDGSIEVQRDGRWVRTERVACEQAAKELGVRTYHARTVQADFYCPTSRPGRRPSAAVSDSH